MGTLSTAFYWACAGNLAHSGLEAMDALIPGFSPSVLQSRFLPRLDSNVNRIQTIAKNINQPEAGCSCSDHSIKVIVEDCCDMMKAHGDLAHGIIGIDSNLLAHRNQNSKYFSDKHITDGCTKEKVLFDEILDNSPNDPKMLIAYLKTNIKEDEIGSLQTHFQFLNFDLSQNEFDFCIRHEKGHLVEKDPKKTLQQSSGWRFVGMVAAEGLAHLYFPQHSMAYCISHLTGYLLSRCAFSYFGKRPQEITADAYAAKDLAAGGVRFFKRQLILGWLAQVRLSTENSFSCGGIRSLFSGWGAIEKKLSYPSIQTRFRECIKRLPSGV